MRPDLEKRRERTYAFVRMRGVNTFVGGPVRVVSMFANVLAKVVSTHASVAPSLSSAPETLLTKAAVRSRRNEDNSRRLLRLAERPIVTPPRAIPRLPSMPPRPPKPNLLAA